MADVRGNRRGGASDAVQKLIRSNEHDELFLANGLPPYTEWSRRGVGWSTMSTSALAALVVRPTTTAGFEIRNNYAAGGPSLVVDRIFAEWRIATAVASGAIMYAMVGAQAAITDGSFVIRGNSGNAYGGKVTAAISQAVTDLGWFPVGPGMGTGLAAATPNGGAEAKMEGRLIVAPGHALCLHVVASVTGDTFIQGASWYEVQLTLE